VGVPRTAAARGARSTALASVVASLGPRLSWLGVRAVLALATVAVVSIAVFAAVEFVPDDPAMAALGREATPEQIADFRARANLDAPAVERYLTWAGGAIRGDFGESVITARPVGDEIVSRLGYTAMLAGCALLFGVLIAIPLAVMAARRPGGVADVLVSTVAVGLVATPEFVLAIVLMLVFGAKLGLVPVISSGIVDGQLSALVLPTCALGLAVVSYVFRLARVSIAEAVTAPYVRTAVLNGLSPRRILWRHIMPNAGAVVVNVIALNALYLLGGVIVIESIFAYPGLGTLLVQAIADNDFVTIEGVSVVLATLFVTINFVADAIVLALNPRLRAA
jgi:peptide/nickel transport system permease protein